MHSKQAETIASLNNYFKPMPAKYNLHKYRWACLHRYRRQRWDKMMACQIIDSTSKFIPNSQSTPSLCSTCPNHLTSVYLTVFC